MPYLSMISEPACPSLQHQWSNKAASGCARNPEKETGIHPVEMKKRSTYRHMIIPPTYPKLLVDPEARYRHTSDSAYISHRGATANGDVQSRDLPTLYRNFSRAILTQGKVCDKGSSSQAKRTLLHVRRHRG